jgi:hypothetical protein
VPRAGHDTSVIVLTGARSSSAGVQPERITGHTVGRAECGEETIEQVGERIVDPVVRVADGEKSMCGWPPARKGLSELFAAGLLAVMCPASFAADTDRRP